MTTYNGKRLRRRVGNFKTLEDALELEAKALQKERSRMDQEEEEDIRTARLRFQQHKDKTMSGMFFSDATRKVDLFWQLDHNDQGLWAWKYLKILQDLDPENRLLVVWCIFPYPRPKNSKPLFPLSDHWVVEIITS
ncbi:hypothetical protein M406DRAFT_330179 [Cryphonectria parasitica EP155]|uniref:Uncharacterized protein n=1 Tax=Cryphonectria parasitica (strain ATCC 38755 / EP155) TaxID=660469 RepID=A0A9P5CPD5_CRYP1|nr:uncharacterized protein M406DRAFT_330179 [Cryphonectria parasitica EP155]KAF3766354.1 hypothetical protein M406DRAFT_330179 [Cryphonectria parasitica EP155]